MAMTQLQCPFCQNTFDADLSAGSDVLTCPHCRQDMQAPTDPEPAVQFRYFYAKNQQRYGPYSFGDLQQFAIAGQILPTDMVLQEYSKQWVPAETLPGLFAHDGHAPQPPQPPPFDQRRDYNQMMYGGDSQPESAIARWSRWAWLHMRRAFMRDLRRVPIQDDEKKKLADQGVEDETLQHYFVWRRSVLVVLCIPVVLIALLNTTDELVNTNFQRLTTFGVVWRALQILAPFAMPLSVVLAAMLWYTRKLSPRIIAVGWAISFCVPIVLYIVPVDWVRTVPSGFTAIRFRVLHGVFFFAMMCTSAVVFLVSISFGAQRACLRLKTLLPHTPLPGLFLIVSAPVLPLLLLPVFVLFTQAAASIYLIAAVTLIVSSCMIYTLWGAAYFRPIATDRDFAILRRVQWTSTALFWAGVVLVFVYGFKREITAPNESLTVWSTKTLLGFTKADSYFQVWTWTFIRIVFFELPGRAFFTVVLVADVLLRLTVSVWYHQEQVSASARGEEIRSSMEKMQQTLNQG